MKRLGLLIAAALLAGASCLQAQTVAIVDGTVIDGNGGKPIEHGVVVIQDRQITAVGGRQTRIPDGAKRIDATGKYVIPGLMDANVHLLLDYWPYTLARYEGRYDELVIEAAQLSLQNGVTTVFDSWGPRADLVKARDDINAGRRIGSRVYLAGNIVGFGGPYTKEFFGEAPKFLFESFVERVNARWQENVGPELLWMPPEQVRKEIRNYLGKGVDFIKYGLNGHNFEEMQYIAFSPRVQQVIVEEAHRAGVTVQTHTTSDEGLLMALDAGVDLMQHCDLTAAPGPIDPQVMRRIVERRIPCALLPHTDAALAWYRDKPGNLLGALLKNGDVNDRALIGSGALILLSTDAGVFSADYRNSAGWKDSQPPEENLTLLGEGHFHWLLAVEQKGMKPMDALMAATRNIARAYKVDKTLGTLEAGKLADLLILDANPLERAANYRSISVIMKEGQVIDRASLPTKRLLTAPDEHAASLAIPTSPRIAALSRAIQANETAASADGMVRAFWREVSRLHTPLFEPVPDAAHEVWATFLWRGTATEAKGGVNVEGEFGDTGNAWPTSEPLRRVADTDVWYATHRVSDRARFSYQLQVGNGKAFADPLNPQKYANRGLTTREPIWFSLGQGAAATSEPFRDVRPGVPQGTVTSFELASTQLGNQRQISVYTPNGMPRGCTQCDFLLIFDQAPYLLGVPTPTILDNMQADGTLKPIVAVLVGNVSRAVRNTELPPNPKFQAFLRDELLPWVRARYEFTHDPARSVVAGASLGGLAAANTALRNPDLFGNVVSQSGSYWWWPGYDQDMDEHDLLNSDSGWLARQFAEAPRRSLRFYMEVGSWEGTLMQLPNRAFRDVLRAKGYEVEYSEFTGGHDYACWRATLPLALKSLLGSHAGA